MTFTPNLQVGRHQICTLVEPGSQLPLTFLLMHPAACSSQCALSRGSSGKAKQEGQHWPRTYPSHNELESNLIISTVIKQWCNACRYPNNFVLRLLTPQDTCRPLDIYPIKLTQDAIYVDVGAAASSRAYQTTRGGADSSIEKNNVYALQPKSYIQGQDPSGD